MSFDANGKVTEAGSAEREQKHKIIVFELGDQTFAVEVDLVREILRFQEIRPVPHTPPSFLGVCTIRGEIIPVIDLAVFLRISSNVELKDKKLIILELKEEGNIKVAVAVDSVRRIYEISEKQMDFTLRESFLGEHLTCIIKQEGENVLLPNFEKIIRAFKLENLKLSKKAFEEADLETFANEESKTEN